ncbi:13 kDa ribonucleoprotein-associated protein [Dictyocoela muelleri]|nr:13 kDa ribonucleoprotein-associated protein [Dictyocoela muelleri]
MKITAYPLATESLNQKILETIKSATDISCIKIGANETVKSLNKNKSLLVVMAADCEPLEILGHLPGLCEDKNVPYVYVRSKDALGIACNINRPVVAVSIHPNDNYYDKLRRAVGEITNELAY